jgi:hypothetical protein
MLERRAAVARKAVEQKGIPLRHEGPSVDTLGLAKATPTRRRKEIPVSRQYVGIDLHRRRSVIVRKDANGELVSKVHIDNDPVTLAEAVAAAGPNPRVVVEATFGWYWAADVLADLGAEVHLAHPLGNNWGNRRVKNDERDATDLVDLLRLGRLAEAWIAPPEIRELREMTRYRYKLSRLRAGLKAQIHAVTGRTACSRRGGTCSGPAARPSSTRSSFLRPTRYASSPCATWWPPTAGRWSP